jgi:P pilus assembly chaperone PapD
MALNGYNFLLGLAMSSIVVANSTHAEIILHGTRVIYPSDAREVTLQVVTMVLNHLLFKHGLMKVILKVHQTNQKFHL